MSTDLATTPSSTALTTSGFVLPAQKYSTDDDFAKEISSSRFLPRLQLCSASSQLVQSDLIKKGRYALVRNKTQFDDLGERIDAFCAGVRLKAIRTQSDPFIATYDPKSQLFQDIKVESLDTNTGAMWGVEVLLWLAEKREWCTYFMASVSARAEGGNIKDNFGGQPLTLTVRLAENKRKQKYHVPVAVRPMDEFELPSLDEISNQANIFANPKQTETEEASPEEKASTDRAR